MEGAPNPTQTLILALQRRDVGRPASLTKDEDFYLAITDPKSDGVRRPFICASWVLWVPGACRRARASGAMLSSLKFPPAVLGGASEDGQ